MHRSYCPHIDFSPPRICITDSKEIHHIKNVLRMNSGDEFEIFNGRGDEILGSIDAITDVAVFVQVKSRRQDHSDGKVKLILACAIPKKAKFEFIIEKATELGVDEIIPMQTARTEVIVEGERADRKNARYQAVAINAAKQSARLTVPLIHPVTPFADVISNAGSVTVKFIPCLLGDRKYLRDELLSLKNVKSIFFLIGPEGDFTPKEVQTALKAGCTPVSLGETTLKVDTAAIAVVAVTRLMLNKGST